MWLLQTIYLWWIHYGYCCGCRRYYFSLILEFSDITMPFVRAVFVKISDAVSFFLVCLIGRSLGLIYTGIRQALGLRWHNVFRLTLFSPFLHISFPKNYGRMIPNSYEFVFIIIGSWSEYSLIKIESCGLQMIKFSCC